MFSTKFFDKDAISLYADRDFIEYLYFPVIFTLWKHFLHDTVAAIMIMTGFYVITKNLFDIGLINTLEIDLKGTKEASNKHLVPFCYDCFWQLGYYGALLLGMGRILLDKPWFWSIEESWWDQEMVIDVWYYLVLNVSLQVRDVIDIIRCKEDATAWKYLNIMVNVSFVGFCWYYRFWKLAGLVMFLNDSMEFLWYSVKVAYYVNLDFLSVSLFGVFSTLRICFKYYFLLVVVKSTSFQSVSSVQGWLYCSLNGLLLSVFLLNCCKTYWIIKFCQRNLSKCIRLDHHRIYQKHDCCKKGKDI
ncbi:unnamed protein product [Phyllotreta striolata]|uniref:TLC domain-containing protein n=1 Tax=Phyllotreta striolata TaxID=444603 RepID=A0A9N9XQX1_PHYSR|nr:unnamed protein product [Phyllotreta striolata]